MPLVPRPKVASKPVSAAISRFTWVPPATRTTLSRMPFSVARSANFRIMVQWGDAELEFLAAETNTTTDDVRLIGTELATRTKGA